jgi:hypothetical protein
MKRGIGMGKSRSLGCFLVLAAGLGSLPASAQSLSTLNSDGMVPMSLMPDAVAIPNAGSFQLATPAAAVDGADGGGAPLPDLVPRKKKEAITAAEPVEPNTTEIVNVPLPPRRPFNLGFGKKQKPLLARAPSEEKKVASLTRSLVPLDDLPGVRIRSNGLVQQASLPKIRDSEIDASEEPREEEDFGRGNLGGAILKQTPGVQTGCLRPNLLAILRKASARFGKPVVITSGFRGGGRRGSYHRKCMAADVKIDGVSKQTLAAYFRRLPEAGGVGTYCHNGVVHIDTAEPRNWSYCGFRRTSFSLRGGGWGGEKHVRSGQALPDSAEDE